MRGASTDSGASRLPRIPHYASVVFDVDSTLVALEGIDWLAELRGPDVARECAGFTARAMAGELPLEQVYTRRLAAIAPTAEELEQLSDVYCAALEPGAVALVHALQAAGCEVYMVSGGLRAALTGLARVLGVAASRLHAVQLVADAEHRLTLLDGAQPLATQSGKPEVIAGLNLARPSVMIGDGATDAAAGSVVDAFIAYTGVARRLPVVAAASAEAVDFAGLEALLFRA